MSETTMRVGAGTELAPDFLMRLATAFWTTKAVAAAVELNLFGAVSDAGGVTVEEAARELGIHRRPADLLLAACASLGLLRKDGDRYCNNEISEKFLVPGGDRYYGALFQYMERRAYPAWAGLVTALRTNRPVAWDPDAQDSVFSPEDRENVEVFWKAMHTISVFTAQALGRALDLTAHHRVLDLGGGSATYGIELSRGHPHLFVTNYDLPHVSTMAAQKVEEAGMGDRVAVVAGDFLADAHLPTGHDVVLLSSILHDWDETTNIGLLKKCFDALPPGGIVVVCEFILNDDRTGPSEAALMGMHMLVETAGGKNYSRAEYADWLNRAGFVDIAHSTFVAPAANGIIVATRPRS